MHVGMGGMGAPGASIDVQAFGRGFSAVTMVDVIVAHSKLWFCLVTGFAAGVLLWTIPAALLALNSALTWLNSGSVSDISAFQRYGSDMLPAVFGTGLLGLFLALLRRISAKTKRYVAMGNMTLSLNTFVASAGGLMLVVWLIVNDTRAGLFVWLLGLGAPLVGFIVDGIWQMFHDALVQRLGKPDKDALLASEVENFLVRHPGLTGFRFKDVTVAGRTATVLGAWDDKPARDRVREVLRCVEGVDRVELVDAAPEAVLH